jgi:DNA topoisomerase-1
MADFPEDGIQVLNGRYGPYVTDGKKNAKVPKDREPKSLTLVECRKMLEEAPARGSRFGRGKRGAGAKAAPASAAPAAAAAAPQTAARRKSATRVAAAARPAAGKARARTPALKTKSPARVLKAAAKRARVK